MDSGVEMNVAEIVERLLAPEGEPRDGVTILGARRSTCPQLVVMK